MNSSTQITIKGIIYNINAEENLTGVAKGFYTSLLSLVRPRGHKEFLAMRDINGNVEIVG